MLILRLSKLHKTMIAEINKTSSKLTNVLFATTSTKLNKEEVGEAYDFVAKEKEKNILIELPGKNMIYVATCKEANHEYISKEKARQAGNALAIALKKRKIEEVTICDKQKNNNLFTAFLEGLFLGTYSFDKYKSKKEKYALEKVKIESTLSNSELNELLQIVEATCLARDFVNETPAYLDAIVFSKEIQKAAKEASLKVEVLNKKQIESLKMGGLLAVNKGSVTPPTFTILEWKPKNAKNKKPIVLVGKGVVYDTGGLDIKTGGSMATMKCDMAGGASVVGAIYAVAKNKLPVHVIALVPATDNRPSGNAYAAGDVLIMHNGKTVEVLNTDAEGRLLLADALSYAQKYKPELVIDVATLTGAAVRAIGDIGIVAMGNVDNKIMGQLANSGNEVYERIAEMPFWDEYGEMIKSNIADIKNIGGATAGQITAGKFLEHFTNYSWIHLDIAGPAFLDKPSHYRSLGGTGTGVRLLYQFIKSKYCSK
jgi:leucyl aminopeptidase